MFHLSKDDLKELNKLKELIGKEIKIYIPRQVRCEYLRNRDSKIKDALDKFKITDVQFPNLVKCYEKFTEHQHKLKYSLPVAWNSRERASYIHFYYYSSFYRYFSQKASPSKKPSS